VFAIVAGDEDDDWGWWGRMVPCHERADHWERTGAAFHRRNDSPPLEDSDYLEYATERPDVTVRAVTRNLTWPPDPPCPPPPPGARATHLRVGPSWLQYG